MSLTPQQRAALIGIASGKTRKETAFDLGISPRTCEKHIAAAMAKIGIVGGDYASAAHYALAMGWIKNKFGGKI